MICNAGFGYYGTVEETSVETMRRMMDVNFMGTFFGARAALPMFRAQATRPPDHHLLHRRPARHSADERIHRDESRAGRVCRDSSQRIRGHPDPCQRRLSRLDGDRVPQCDGARLRPTVAGLGPKQSVDHVARAIVACVRRPRPEVYPHTLSRGLAILNAVAPGFTDRLVRNTDGGAAPCNGTRHADRVYAQIPGGSFAMGSLDGQEDEAPVHS